MAASQFRVFVSSINVRMKMKNDVSFLHPEHKKFMLVVLSAGLFPLLLYNNNYVIEHVLCF